MPGRWVAVRPILRGRSAPPLQNSPLLTPATSSPRTTWSLSVRWARIEDVLKQLHWSATRFKGKVAIVSFVFSWAVNIHVLLSHVAILRCVAIKSKGMYLCYVLWFSLRFLTKL